MGACKSKNSPGEPAAMNIEDADLTSMLGGKLLTKDGEVPIQEALAGKKHIMIYFSAHWCPPCRGFTPQLAEAYKASPLAGKETIIVFASSDSDQAAFDGYYGEMPWYALPYSERDLKEKLSQKYKVEGIPSLVVLDGNGKLITTDGRAKFMDYLGKTSPAPAAAPAGSAADLDVLLGSTLLSKDGEVSTKEAVAGKENILIYFSAHWCPPCRGFTPQLADAYKKSPKAGKQTMVIFASSDKDQAGFDGYYGEMPWHALPFSNRALKETLSQKFGVKGIPMLVVLDASGNLITTEGRGKYGEYL